MATLPINSVMENDTDALFSTNPKVTGNSPSYHRPPFVTPSMRSSRSGITLGSYDRELATYDETKLVATHDVTKSTNVLRWFHHLLAVFCVPRPKKILSTAPKKLTGPTDHEARLNSPWVLPVYVLSIERDADNHQVPKEAKCTIDTGNMQGNIVSRAFVVDVLGYSESNFDKLTKAEEEGGTGITGHKFIPGGAIYLTWYHKSSTRVFRDMRFLVSEHPMYELIVGARSIYENNILDVPNLMNGPGRVIADVQWDKLQKEHQQAYRLWSNSNEKAYKEREKPNQNVKSIEYWKKVLVPLEKLSVLTENRYNLTKQTFGVPKDGKSEGVETLQKLPSEMEDERQPLLAKTEDERQHLLAQTEEELRQLLTETKVLRPLLTKTEGTELLQQLLAEMESKSPPTTSKEEKNHHQVSS